MTWIHPLYPHPHISLVGHIAASLSSFLSLSLFISAVATYNAIILNWPESGLDEPDTIDIWPCLAVGYSLIFSACSLASQHRTVTQLATPQTADNTRGKLRRVRPAVGRVIGELIAWTAMLTFFILVLRFSFPFKDNYVNRGTVSRCPRYTVSHPATLEYYCNGNYVAVANLEIAGGCFLMISVGAHMVLFVMACLEVHKKRREKSRTAVNGGMNIELQGETGSHIWADGRETDRQGASQK